LIQKKRVNVVSGVIYSLCGKLSIPEKSAVIFHPLPVDRLPLIPHQGHRFQLCKKQGMGTI